MFLGPGKVSEVNLGEITCASEHSIFVSNLYLTKFDLDQLLKEALLASFYREEIGSQRSKSFASCQAWFEIMFVLTADLMLFQFLT